MVRNRQIPEDNRQRFQREIHDYIVPSRAGSYSQNFFLNLLFYASLEILFVRQLVINNLPILGSIFVCLLYCINRRIASYVTVDTVKKAGKKAHRWVGYLLLVALFKDFKTCCILSLASPNSIRVFS